MRSLRQIQAPKSRKRRLSKGMIILAALAFAMILSFSFALIRPREKRVSVEMTPGNIYTDVKGQNDENTPEDERGDSDAIPEEGVNGAAKVDDFSFYKVLSSKEGEVAPLKVKPVKPVTEKEPHSAASRDKTIEQIDSEIVKKIESREKDNFIYTVQIGALRQEKAAHNLAENIRAKGFVPYIASETTPGRPPVYKIRVGRFLSMVDAQEVAAVLKKEGYSTYVLKISVQE